MKQSSKKSPVITTLEWVLTIILAVLFVRLLILIFNLIFNFSDTPFGERFKDGFSFDFSNISFKSVVIQLVIFAVVIGLVIASKKEKNKSDQ